VSLEVAVFKLYAGAVRALGDEPDLDLTGEFGAGLYLPLGADVPAEHHPVRRLVDQDPCPMTFAAVFGPVIDMSTDPRLEHRLGNRCRKEIVLWWLKSPNRSVNTMNARAIGAPTTICL
jgi:hypothetical protein